MKPERNSLNLLSITQAKAKMYEYSVPAEHHIEIPRDPAGLFDLTIGLLGDISAQPETNGSGNYPTDRINDIRFAARFFDSYRESRLSPQIDPYLAILASASYYMSGLPGSSQVVANQVALPCPDLGCHGLEDLLLWTLRGEFLEPLVATGGVYAEQINSLSRGLVEYFKNGNGAQDLSTPLESLRRTAYDNGTSRQLLFSDLISALVRSRVTNSTWYCLPRYTNLSVDPWKMVLQKRTFIRELWPSQHLLGKEGIFQGVHSVVQMPTSAGKTRAIEVLLRSAFLSNRANRAIVVAPFKALCNEIRQSLNAAFKGEDVLIDEFSDVMQADFDIPESQNTPQILISTPEKLVYVLRYVPRLSDTVGLLVLDEGHQFDNGLRGVTYELLLTSLKALIPTTAQKVLVSAVISNADAINLWLNGTSGKVVTGGNLNPTFRAVAFASWQAQLGRLQFISPDNPTVEEFFVPRVIEQRYLQLRGRERTPQRFPERDEGQSVALFLGLQLVRNGSVAIFCGRKDTAANLGERVVNAYERGLDIASPSTFSNQQEMQRLLRLHERHLGSEAAGTRSAVYGVFAHHGNTPHGIRLAVEYAMKNGLAKFVICTSTLAQGVNLPIRYLIVTSVYQGAERIRVRDFQNLIGRAGRSGMHTEGTIIFADPKVYDKRFSRTDRWRWTQSIELLNPGKAEPCASTLLSIFHPFESDDKKFFVDTNPLVFVQHYLSGIEQLQSFEEEIVDQHSALGFSHEGISAQMEWKSGIISAIESFLMAQWDIGEKTLSMIEVAALAQGTLAYHLANDIQRGQLVELFSLLANNIQEKAPEAVQRRTFGKTLLGLSEILDIQKWVRRNIDQLSVLQTHGEFMRVIWPILSSHSRNRIMRQCEPRDALLQTALDWIEGKPYFELHRDIIGANARLVTRSRKREIKLEQIIDLCENSFGYDCTLLLGAIIEIVAMTQSQQNEGLVGQLQLLQKRLKYGLPSIMSINLYELGFSDRVISLELTNLLGEIEPEKRSIRDALNSRESELRGVLDLYPSFFQEVLNRLL